MPRVINGLKGTAYYLDIVSPASRSFKRRIVRLDRLRRVAQRADTSSAGEYTAIRNVLADLEIQLGFCVDIAASDGVSSSSTLPLFRRGWSGIAVEMNPEKFSALAFIYSEFPGVSLARVKITPANVASLLKSLGAPTRFQFLNLDIDSYDKDVLEAIIVSGLRPEIISMEINEKIPPPLYFSVDYREDHVWQGDHFYGCSIQAAYELLSSFGYGLVDLAYNNALFVDSQTGHSNVQTMTPHDAYVLGYKNRPERSSQFPWNSDVDVVLGMSPREAESFFRMLFAGYAGRYQLHVVQ